VSITFWLRSGFTCFSPSTLLATFSPIGADLLHAGAHVLEAAPEALQRIRRFDLPRGALAVQLLVHEGLDLLGVVPSGTSSLATRPSGSCTLAIGTISPSRGT
jgi:hypothetical protein